MGFVRPHDFHHAEVLGSADPDDVDFESHGADCTTSSRVTAWEGEPPIGFLMHGRELEARDGENPLITHGTPNLPSRHRADRRLSPEGLAPHSSSAHIW